MFFPHFICWYAVHSEPSSCPLPLKVLFAPNSVLVCSSTRLLSFGTTTNFSLSLLSETCVIFFFFSRIIRHIALGLPQHWSRDDNFGYTTEGLALRSLLKMFEVDGEYCRKLNDTTTIQEEAGVLSKPVHDLSDRYLLDLYQFATKAHGRKSFAFHLWWNSQISESFWSAVGKSPSSAEIISLIRTRSKAGFKSIQKVKRRGNKRSISIDIIILFARNLPTNMARNYSYSRNDDPQLKRATCGAFSCGPLKHTKDFQSNEIMGNDHSLVTFTI